MTTIIQPWAATTTITKNITTTMTKNIATNMAIFRLRFTLSFQKRPKTKILALFSNLNAEILG